MKERLFICLSAASLVLFVLAATLWVANTAAYPEVVLWGDAWDHVNGAVRERRGIVSTRGGVTFHVFYPGPPPRVNLAETGVDVTEFGYSELYPDWLPAWRTWGGSFLGFSATREASITILPPHPGRCLGRQYFWNVPHWFILAMTALAPLGVAAAAIRHMRASRRLREGRCTYCGYDLRATVEKCPECGATPETLTATA